MNAGTNRFDCTGSLMAHDDGRNAAAGRAVVTVHVTAADAAGRDAKQDFVGTWRGRRKIGEFEMLVAGEEKGFHCENFQSSVSVVSLRTSRESTIEVRPKEIDPTPGVQCKSAEAIERKRVSNFARAEERKSAKEIPDLERAPPSPYFS